MTNLDELKALAEAATPGKWSVYNNGFDGGVVCGMRKTAPGEYSTFDCGFVYDKMITGGEPCEGYLDGPDAFFIAAASPQTVLAMLEVIEAGDEVRNDDRRSLMESRDKDEKYDTKRAALDELLGGSR